MMASGCWGAHLVSDALSKAVLFWGNAASPCGGLVVRVTELSATTVSFLLETKMIGWSLKPHRNSLFILFAHNSVID